MPGISEEALSKAGNQIGLPFSTGSSWDVIIKNDGRVELHHGWPVVIGVVVRLGHEVQPALPADSRGCGEGREPVPDRVKAAADDLPALRY